MRFLSLALLVTVSACGIFDAKSPESALFECRVAAVEPAVGHAYDAAQVVHAVYERQLNLSALLAQIKASEVEVRRVVEALKACGDLATAPTFPAPDAG